MDYEGFIKFINSRKWIFAKTMPKNPHEYTLRKGVDDKEFVEAVIFIRQNGYQDRFYRKFYTCFNAEGYKYWTMGDPLDQTILINRAKLKGKTV